MPLASVIWTWEQGGRIYSRLTTNVPAKRFLARMSALQLLAGVETVHAFFGDRVDGGNGYEVLWKENVRWEDLKKLGQI